MSNLDATYRKIHIVRVPAYSPHAIAEHTVALMLSLNRKTHRAYLRTRENNFTINGLLGFDMHGKTAGVIGTGKIGKAVIGILKGFGMRILAFDVYPDHKFAEQTGIEYVNLDTIYQQSDIVTLHCPLTPENVHMINTDTISRMKDGVMIINTGRGKLLNTRDLITGLKEKKSVAQDLMYTRRKGIIFLRIFLLNQSVMTFWQGCYLFLMCWSPHTRHFSPVKPWRRSLKRPWKTYAPTSSRIFYQMKSATGALKANAQKPLQDTASDLFFCDAFAVVSS